MRRIATKVATGAVAAAAAICLAAAPASAGIQGSGAVAAGSTAATAAQGFGTEASWHGWHSYNGSSTVYAHGSYKHTSAYTYVTGYVTDHRSGTYHAAVVLYFTQKGKSGYQWAGVVNPHHGDTVRFPKEIVATYHTHFYVAEALAKYEKGKGWVVVKRGHLHKFF